MKGREGDIIYYNILLFKNDKKVEKELLSTMIYFILEMRRKG